MKKRQIILCVISFAFCISLFSTVIRIGRAKPLTEKQKSMSLADAIAQCNFFVVEYLLTKQVTADQVREAIKDLEKIAADKKEKLKGAKKRPLAVQAGIQRAVYRCEGVVKLLQDFENIHKFIDALDVAGLKEFFQKRALRKTLLELGVEKAKKLKRTSKQKKKCDEIIALLQKKKQKTIFPVIYYQFQPRG